MNQLRLANRALLVLLLAITGGLQGCVTVPAEGSPTKKDIQEAVQDRVAAGLKYIQRGEPSSARRHISRALELDDDSAVAHNAMALLYRYERDPEQEEKHYRQALRADGGYAPAHNNYGILLYSDGRHEEAKDHFMAAANNSAYESRGLAWGNLGQVYQAMGQPDEARQAFIKSVRLNPNQDMAHLRLAELYFKEGNYRLANNYYQQYVKRAGRQSARGLWLGIRLAAHFGNSDKQSSYELALKQLYPGSREYEKWRAWRGEASGQPASGESDARAGADG